MSYFDIHKYNKNQYLAEAGLASSKAQSLANLIENSITQTDESLQPRDFAVAVGIILKENYDKSTSTQFIKDLHLELGINESLNEEINIDAAKNDFQTKFNVGADLRVYGDNGELRIKSQDDIDDEEFKEMVKFVEELGYKVNLPQSSNWYYTDGDKMSYPTIKFSK